LGEAMELASDLRAGTAFPQEDKAGTYPQSKH
jgi:hypothetical protein